MKTNFLIAVSFLFLLSSCVKDKGSVTMTYNKGTAVYADLDAVRSKTLIGTTRQINDPGKIFIDENMLLIGEEDEGIHVYDNTNPASPVNVSFIQLPFCKEFYVENNMIYAESQYDFVKIDITNLSLPTLVNRVEFAFGDAIFDHNGNVLVGFDYAVVTESFDFGSAEELALRESSNLFYNSKGNLIPESSVPSSFTGNSESIKGTLNKITVNNNYVYVVGDSKLYTFYDAPNQMNLVNETDISLGLETIYPEGNNLYLGTQTSMIVVDASNPSSPEYTSEYEHPTSCDPVLPNGNVAYLTLRTADFSGCNGDENTVEVLDISDVNNPEPLNSYTVSSPYGMNIINNYLFVGEGNNGLTIFDISNPQFLAFQTTLSNVTVYDIMPHPTDPSIILTTGDNGLVQYNIDYATLTLTELSSINY